MIEFLVNHTPVEIDDVAPNTSALDWLRTKSGLTGSKEGCASGDCGACTVIVGANTGDGVRYQSMNACLLMLGNLHGKHLITVDALSDVSATTVEQLHPVQRAMVECHGSQCGFCTPGFIMSMFGLYLNYREYPGRATVIEQLGGNLCRCTGYRPILEACQHMYEFPRVADPFTEAANEFFQRPLNPEPCLTHNGQQFFLPQSLPDLLALKDQYPQAKLLAGGTDLALEFTQQLRDYDTLISVTEVAELQHIRDDEAGLTLGAAATYADLVPTLCARYPEAKEMFHRLGSAQIRNAGTLGGSLGNASPIGDPAPLLMALDAQIILANAHGERSVPVGDFFLAYRKTVLADNEVIVAVRIPPRSSSLTLACYKISKRMEDDISAVLLAIAFEQVDGVMRNVKTGFGGMAATPAAAQDLETFLAGKPFTEAVMAQAGDVLVHAFNPMTDVRASRDYRLTTCRNLLQRFWLEQSEQTITRVSHAAL